MNIQDMNLRKMWVTELKAHLDGLNKLGITPYHRKSFEPIKSMT